MRPATISKELAAKLAKRLRADMSNETARDVIDIATGGELDPWQLDTLTDWAMAFHTDRGTEERGHPMKDRVHIAPKTLSDGSIVYDVQMPRRWFGAITYADALAMAEKVATAINEHTNEVAEVKELCVGRTA